MLCDQNFHNDNDKNHFVIIKINPAKANGLIAHKLDYILCSRLTPCMHDIVCTLLP